MEKIIKSLIKNPDAELLEQYLKDPEFKQELINYQDKDQNNIFHLLFKSATNDNVVQVEKMAKMLHQNGVSLLHLNLKQQTPYDVIEQSYLAVAVMEMQKEELNL